MADKEDAEPLTTKIYYFVDEQSIAYSTEIPVPPSKITLAHFKQNINRRNYKFYCKTMDTTLNTEVKTDILNEDEILKPNSAGRFELFLLSDNNNANGGASSSSSAIPPPQNYRASVRGNSELKNYQSAKGCSAPYRNPNQYYYEKRYMDDSSSQEDSMFYDSNLRSLSLSDEDSQSSSALIPQGKHYYGGSYSKPYKMRNRRKRQKRSFSFLSNTFEDTDISMRFELTTVTFHLDDPKKQFGMSVMAKEIRGMSYIYVHEVIDKGVVALDGRIKPGFMILEVDGISLAEYDSDSAIGLIRSRLQKAHQNRGHITLTCSSSEDPVEPFSMNMFRVQQDPVQPIDPTTWVLHCNAINGLNIINEESEHGISPNVNRHSMPSIQYACTNNLPVQNWPAAAPEVPLHSSVPTSNATVSGGGGGGICGPSSGVGSSIASSGHGRKSPHNFIGKPFHVEMDKREIVCAMADPISGLQLRTRSSLKNSFLGSELLSWLEKNVAGLESSKSCKDYASNLLKEHFILQAVTKKEFTQQCYYTFNDQLMSKFFQTAEGINTIKRGALTLIQNPAAMELNSSDELTFTTTPSDPYPPHFHKYLQNAHNNKPKNCKGGFSCILRRILCLHANLPHTSKINAKKRNSAEYTPVKKSKNQAEKLKVQKQKNNNASNTVQCESTHIP